MKDIRKDILFRAYLVYLGVLVFAIAIIAKAIYIQSVEGDELLKRAKKQEMRLTEIEAIRGNICSDNGTLLATSIPIFDIRMDVCSEHISDEFFTENVDSLSWFLSRLFKDRKMSEYKTLLCDARRNGDRYLLIRRNVLYPELRQMRKFPIFRLGKYKGGMIVEPSYRRELPYKSLAKRTIGYESEESPNKIFVGLEGAFSNNLLGSKGERLERRIGNSAWIPVDIENQVEPQNGQDIITTIDVNLQDLVESALQKELTADSADHGCAIVMEVKTGYIKAIANLGRAPGGGFDEVFNYAIGEASEPGSTFKLASFLVALEDNKVTLDMPINLGNGIMMYHGRKMSDAHTLTGTLTARQVFEKSSNVGTSKMIYMAYGAEPQKYIDGLYRMSIQRPLNLQIGGEAKPYIKNTSSKWWSAVTLPWMSIGYEVAVSPLQTLTLYNAVANNGVMLKPLMVKEIRRNGEVIQSFPPIVINPHIVSQKTILQAKELLEGVVDHGTAVSLKNPVYKIAGKTGTAQVAQNNKGYQQGTRNIKYKGSFVGYFPADNPRYSVIVVINNPSRGKYYGGAVAGPVFKAIADRIYAGLDDINNSPPRDTLQTTIPYAHAGMKKDINEVYSLLGIPVKPDNTSSLWAMAVADPSRAELIPRQVSKGIMPDVIGMGAKDAVFMLEGLGLKVIINGKGNVIRQSIEPGKTSPAGQYVFLDLSVPKS